MAARKAGKANVRGTYVYGNTVRKTAPQPEYPQREGQNRYNGSNLRKKRAIKRNQEKAMQMSPGYILFLSAMATLLFVVCVAYIKLQSEITTRLSSIATYEEDIANLKSENDAAYAHVQTSINLDEIKNRAINELGMVYASKDQIVYYELEDTDYMSQYADIPEDEKKTILDILFND